MYVFVHMFPVTAWTVSDCKSPNGADLPLGVTQISSWSQEDLVSVLGLICFYILLEFPKQIKTALF